ncbi:putative signal transduction protein containing Nacht domain (plasmid) [Anabaenopsis circularis NIES-21]|uniref:Putative signal transduction protein containing Nacht domain n=1 Tax=Anabaenopsis circularis NIES-21 TaxID=1085406 RepID=A0A1Z4GR95_9CYAN|nr:putative signal transduction protein containing Nacht domain [Anabaenopsis circularis NIES-21]
MCGHRLLTNLFLILFLATIPRLVFAQTPLVQNQCTDVEIDKHIRQLNKSEPVDFQALVDCKSIAVPFLIKALKENKDEDFRTIITVALGEIGMEAKPAVSVLKELLNDKKENIRIVVVYALEKIIGKDSVQPLNTALKDENNDVRSSAAEAFAKIGKDAVPALITALKDENYNVRSSASQALVEIGKDAVPALITTLKDENSDARCSAAEALAEIGKDAVPPLIIALKEPDSYIRTGSANALGKIGADAEDAIPFLSVAVKDANSKVSFAAINALDEIRRSVSFRRENPPRKKPINNGKPEKIDEIATDYLKKKPPVICKIPLIESVLTWKCLGVKR